MPTVCFRAIESKQTAQKTVVAVYIFPVDTKPSEKEGRCIALFLPWSMASSYSFFMASSYYVLYFAHFPLKVYLISAPQQAFPFQRCILLPQQCICRWCYWPAGNRKCILNYLPSSNMKRWMVEYKIMISYTEFWKILSFQKWQEMSVNSE